MAVVEHVRKVEDGLALFDRQGCQSSISSWRFLLQKPFCFENDTSTMQNGQGSARPLDIRELARRAKVATGTIVRLERAEAMKERTVEAIARTFEAAGIEFIAAEVLASRWRNDEADLEAI